MRIVNKEYTTRLVLNSLGDFQVEIKDPDSGMWILSGLPTSSMTTALELFHEQSARDLTKTNGGTILCQS